MVTPSEAAGAGSGGGVPVWVWILLAAVVVAGILAAVVMARGRRRRQWDEQLTAAKATGHDLAALITPLAAADLTAPVRQQLWDQIGPRATQLQATLTSLRETAPDAERTAAATEVSARLQTAVDEAGRLTQSASDAPADEAGIVAARARVRLAAEELAKVTQPPPPPAPTSPPPSAPPPADSTAG